MKPYCDGLLFSEHYLSARCAATDLRGGRRVTGVSTAIVEIPDDAMEIANRLDHLILFSGEGDFRGPVKAVQRKGVRLSVVNTLPNSPQMVADESRRQADGFIDLLDLAPRIRCAPLREEARTPTPARPAVDTADAG